MKGKLKTNISFYEKKTVESFDAVHIIFMNRGAGNIRINDHFLLGPGETLDLGFQYGYVDTTPYRLQFFDNAILTVIYKTLI